jgi:hypothetical protein
MSTSVLLTEPVAGSKHLAEAMTSALQVYAAHQETRHRVWSPYVCGWADGAERKFAIIGTCRIEIDGGRIIAGCVVDGRPIWECRVLVDRLRRTTSLGEYWVQLVRHQPGVKLRFYVSAQRLPTGVRRDVPRYSVQCLMTRDDVVVVGGGPSASCVQVAARGGLSHG